MTYLSEADRDRSATLLQAASCTYRIALAWGGQKVSEIRMANRVGGA